LERYTLAYRLPDGAVRGFVGHGLSRREAYYDCVRIVEGNLRPFRSGFDLGDIVRGVADLADAERARVHSDWHSRP
jgi:hypothetical protein